MSRRWRVGHRWLGVLAALVVLVSAVTGWLMQHESWLQGREFKSVALDPHSSRHLLAAGPQGLWRSEDAGVTWKPVTMPVPTEHVSALTAGGAGFAVALRDFGVWTSTDGYIWDRVLDAPENERIKALSFQEGKLVYLTEAALIVAGQRFEQPRSIRRLVHDWHTGWALGRTGTILVEAGAIATMVLTASGLVLAWRTRRRKRPTFTPQIQPVDDATEQFSPVAH
jgi:hypothetical protein